MLCVILELPFNILSYWNAIALFPTHYAGKSFTKIVQYVISKLSQGFLHTFIWSV